jgi:hypothetical protein
MTTDPLTANIARFFPTHRAFIAAFNWYAGFEALNETTLSRQLSGRVALSNGWKAAYAIVFERWYDYPPN